MEIFILTYSKFTKALSCLLFNPQKNPGGWPYLHFTDEEVKG